MIQGCVRIMTAVRICGSSAIDAIRLYVDMTLLMVSDFHPAFLQLITFIIRLIHSII